MGGRAWTEEDDAFLRANAETMTNDEMGRLLGRTGPSVQLRVNRVLKIKGDNGRKPRRLDTYHRETTIEAGQKIGSLEVKDIFVRDINGIRAYYCRCTCDCGKEVERRENDLKHRDNHSCGCVKIAKSVERLTTHGMSGTHIYGVWSKMKDRCLNPNHEGYKDYGGRGITVCDEWLNDAGEFVRWAIANGYRDDLSIDRVDNSAGYSPENCRWVTAQEQANNRRDNHILNIFGESKTVSQWSEDPRAKACELTIRSRLFAGWGDEEAVITPAGEKRNRQGSGPAVAPGDRFGQLEVVSTRLEQRGKQRSTLCSCKCDCGNTKDLWANSLRSGFAVNCGCDRRANAMARQTYTLRNRSHA